MPLQDKTARINGSGEYQSMNKNINMTENKDMYNDDEITLGEIIGYILDRFMMVAIITLILTITGIIVSVPLKKEYAVTAQINISEPYGTEVIKKYGGRYINAEEEICNLFSQSNIEKVIDGTYQYSSGEKLLYKDVLDELHYRAEGKTNIYDIYISKTADTEYWTAFISNLVNNKINSTSEIYLADAEAIRETITESIANYEELLASGTDHEHLTETVISLRNDLSAIEYYISNLDSTINWISKPTTGSTVVGTKKSLIVLVFFLLGGIIGVITALALGFNDKLLYSSQQIKKTAKERLLASIPLYKNVADMDSREFEYIVSKLNLTAEKTVALLSLSSKAGIRTIHKGLTIKSEAEITDFSDVFCNPHILAKLSNYSYTIIVLRAGIDDTVHLERIINDLQTVGINNYCFILNAVDVSDDNVTVYLPKDKYRRHKWLLESWKSYYRRNNH